MRLTENTLKLVISPKTFYTVVGVFIIPANVIAPEGDDWGVFEKGVFKNNEKGIEIIEIFTFQYLEKFIFYRCITGF